MMKKKSVIVSVICVALAVVGAASAITRNSNYGEDRAQIEDLQARYMFALDWQDADVYASTFTEDGILDWAGGVTRGRDAIRADVHGMRENFAKREAADAPLRPARMRHVITNITIRIDGDHAFSRAYWFELNDDGPERKGYLGAYGHYEDELRKVKGQWLFSKRKIYNEQMNSRAAMPENPAW